METLLLKLVATPILIAAASLAGRRWGPGVGGWLVGLPFTSGPIALFLALDHGVSFAAVAAAGTLAGTISQAAFALIYGRTAFAGWVVALGAGLLGFGVVTVLLQHVTLSLGILFPLVALSLGVAIRLMPEGTHVPAGVSLPAWDLPARMAIATAFVLALTALAAALGPQLTGLLAPLPLYAGVLTVFAHRLEGPNAARAVLRGLLFGLFAFAVFFLTLSTLLTRISLPLAFAAAVAAALTVQALSLVLLRSPTEVEAVGSPSP